MTDIPEPVAIAYKEKAQSVSPELLGELYEVPGGFACSSYIPGQDVSYPTYVFRDTGEVEEVGPLSEEWFDLLRLSPGYGEDEKVEEAEEE